MTHKPHPNRTPEQDALEQPSHKSAESMVAVPRIERGTRGL